MLTTTSPGSLPSLNGNNNHDGRLSRCSSPAAAAKNNSTPAPVVKTDATVHVAPPRDPPLQDDADCSSAAPALNGHPHPHPAQETPPPLPHQHHHGGEGQRHDPTSAHLSLDILRYTPIPTLVLDRNYCIRQVSDSYLAVSRDSCRESVLGSHIDNFLDHSLTFLSVCSARKAINAALKTRRPHTVEEVADDQKTAWSIRVVPIFRMDEWDYLVMEFTDTSEEFLKQVELDQRMTTNETFRILVETVKDYAIFMLDPDGNIATWNAGAEKFKGYTKDEIIGKHFSNFYGDEDKRDDKPGRELKIALRDGRVEDEGWRYRKDGSKFWANVVITPVYRGDTLIGFGKVTRDLTERRAAESRLVAAYEESAKLKSEFLANMSHEIRTPMHGMLSALTLLLDTNLDPEQLELARVIEESGGVLLQVINDILDYSKLASGCFSISFDIINVRDIIGSVMRNFHANTTAATRLESDIDPRLPVSAEGDSLRYRQIVQNLLSNATKFTEEGYVRVHVKLQSEDLNTYTILTEVIDTGIGIPTETSGTLFTPFTQFDNSATKRYKGTGLGLSICKSLAELMGGQIGYHRNPEGKGSIFWFTTVMKRARKAKAIEDLQETMAALSTNPTVTPLEELKQIAEGKRVLLAEDNHINTTVMRKMLKGLGFNSIDCAVDGKEAATLAINNPAPYDVILMDINMPILDGVASTQQIRNAGVTTPIIAMTANALKGHAETYLSKGMDFYVAKPVDRKLLMKGLLKCLKEEEP
jgi:osomolarity two-component system sensor histidine kinase TcsA